MRAVTGAPFSHLQYKKPFITDRINSQEAGIQNRKQMEGSVCSVSECK